VDTSSGDSRFRIFDYSSRVRSWEQARAACRRLGRGWDLVKINNRREDNIVKTFLREECSNYGDGWFIGGKSTNGRWRWADNSRMIYNNFPRPSSPAFGLGRPQSTVVNYAVIFKSDFLWGYVAPRPPPRMGYICEKQCR
ncbi:dromaiocalcin-2-like, partial [Saccostrea echinata]|uniref:dromaiocalcin-2-like n=1 Tax=Saccostrea echinata TaxID=191078 RepID=UPI002A7FB10D